MPPWASIIVSVAIVLVFAEVLPMAICTRYGLEVGARLSWLVNVLIVICYPIAWPISKILDWMFGHSAGTLFKRSQLKELINMHSKHSIQTAEDVEAELAKLPVEERLTSHEVQLIKNALDLNSRLSIEISTAIDEVYMLEYSQVCDREVIGSIVHFGLHFCVPVYRDNRDNVIGIIRVGDLISLSPDDNLAISDLELDPIPKLTSDTPVYHAMTRLQSQKSQIALLVDPQLTRIPVAVLTMEDIIEELVAGQIPDMPIFPTSREGENVLEEWMGPTDEELRHLHLETDSTSSNKSTVSLPVRPRPQHLEHAVPHPLYHSPIGSQQVIALAMQQAARPTTGTGVERIVSLSPGTPNMKLHHSLTSSPQPAPLLGHQQRKNIQELDRQTELEERILEHGEEYPGLRPFPLKTSASWSSLAPRRYVPATLADFETSSVASDLTSASTTSSSSYGSSSSSSSNASSAFSVASVGTDFAPALGTKRPRTGSLIDGFVPSSASSDTSNKSIARIPTTKSDRKSMKDPNVAHKVEKKLNVASVVATALKRSSSSISMGSNATLPVIYKRNRVGDAVVDPSKLLSASHGDLTDIPALAAPPSRTLSASHEALPQLDEEQVHLDW